jgi:mRNA-degrading endonuclease RelE of RelBE toxin-antitoxin system
VQSTNWPATPLTALKGSEWKGCFRKRVGDYRMIFTLDHDAHAVMVLAVLRRSEKTYR